MIKSGHDFNPDDLQKGKAREPVDLEKVREIQNFEWTYAPGPLGDWIIRANGFDIAGTFDSTHAQAILANAIDRQTLLTQNDALIEDNKRLRAIIKRHIEANSVKSDRVNG